MPESGVIKHNYLFCQFVNPARGHEGDRCDCFDTPSQRRTTLAKQRLARLRANRGINRASTSNDPESAVASDPAVTIDHSQLPIILKAPNARKAVFTLQHKNTPKPISKTQYYIGSVTIHPQTMQSTDLMDVPDELKQDVLREVPDEYKRHKQVFDEEKSQRLPRHSVWDHAIELLPDAPATLPGRLLPLTQTEQAEMSKFVQEHLKRGAIRESWSPYAANFFFIKKRDRKLRPVQDYRPINKWTRKNRNSMPLIPQTIDHLTKCTLFTKFDVRWGYNNVRIKPGDEWKAAFLTHKGLFEPTVMFFGLTNSPATFQMMMNTIFRKEVAQGWLSVYMDDIAIHSKPNEGETDDQHKARHTNYTHLVLESSKRTTCT